MSFSGMKRLLALLAITYSSQDVLLQLLILPQAMHYTSLSSSKFSEPNPLGRATCNCTGKSKMVQRNSALCFAKKSGQELALGHLVLQPVVIHILLLQICDLFGIREASGLIAEFYCD